MGRKKKQGFTKMKMLASRIEESDYFKLELFLGTQNKNVQQAINAFVVSCISGNLSFSGSYLVITGSVP
jgi:hypothetical protein